MRRELRMVVGDKAIGAVVDKPAKFEGAAAQQFAQARERSGDAETARILIENGWSNGYLYLADPTD